MQAYVETAFSVLTGVLAILTVFWRDWIEAFTGWDPDNHNGSFEALIVVGLAVTSLALGLTARRTWTRFRQFQVNG